MLWSCKSEVSQIVAHPCIPFSPCRVMIHGHLNRGQWAAAVMVKYWSGGIQYHLNIR
jgi:hypothetical protein